MITFKTDKGLTFARAAVSLFPKHNLNPDAIMLGSIFENEEQALTFHVTHREVIKRGEQFEVTRVVLPAADMVVSPGVRIDEGPVGDTRELLFKDTVYSVNVMNRSLGDHKEVIALKDRRDRVLIELPVIWQRIPFLSSAPDRVILGDRPVRVFLRCPDSSVELTRIAAHPAGVNAVISSTREVTVWATEETAAIVDDALTIETSWRDHALLRIPIVRFSPVVSKE